MPGCHIQISTFLSHVYLEAHWFITVENYKQHTCSSIREWHTPVLKYAAVTQNKADLYFLHGSPKACLLSKAGCKPWLWVGESIILVHRGCWLAAQSGHVQEPIHECRNKWNNQSMSFSFSPFLSLRAMFKKTSSKKAHTV